MEDGEVPYEIERKFLLKNDKWKKTAKSEYICQGYMRTEKGAVRVRIFGEKAFITIKGKTEKITRKEFEYEIPVADARELLDNFCERPYIEKTRNKIEFKGFEWIVDEFHGENAGLLLAELELDSEDQEFPVPEWIGEEVSGDPRYFNSNLVRNPFSKWK
jgi:CYTH domain-containing protein